MPMTTCKETNCETPNHYSFWSYCLAIVSVFAIADILTGGLLRESLIQHKIEYGVTVTAMIVTLGVLVKDGPPGLKFVRACSRHKL